jgi:IS5 family transposase
MGRWGVAVGPAVVKQIHDRMVQIAREHRVAEGRRMRVDTTVVETNIHYPTDSSLLGDGVRVLTRTMKKIAGIAGAAGAKLRDRSRSVKLRMLEIARAARSKRSPSQTRLKEAYRKLLNATGRVLGQAKRFAPSARHPAAGDRGGSARLAVRADRAPHQRLHDLRRRPTARPQPQRQTAGAEDRAGGPRQRSTKRPEAGAVLPQITAGNRPGVGQARRFAKQIGDGV